MGLFSKLFGNDKNVEKAAKGLLDDIFSAADRAAGSKPSPSTAPSSAAPSSPAPAQTSASTAPHGNSWGEFMPDEENQFNYNGSFTQYFEHIFAEDFPDYRYEKYTLGSNNRCVYTFFDYSSKVLVIELMPESCSAAKLRNECKAERVPYLRFYYNHDGWWNTRSYVVDRMYKALRGSDS